MLSVESDAFDTEEVMRATKLIKEQIRLDKTDPTYHLNKRNIGEFSSEDLQKVKEIVGLELAKRNLKQL
jgi:hypothetical protein